MADIDRHAFGRAVEQRLVDEGLSYRQACVVWPDLTTATISRAVNGFVLTAANMLLICQCLDIDPFPFLRPGARPHGGKRLPRYERNQSVAVASREIEVGIGDILHRWSTRERAREAEERP